MVYFDKVVGLFFFFKGHTVDLGTRERVWELLRTRQMVEMTNNKRSNNIFTLVRHTSEEYDRRKLIVLCKF